MIFDTSEPNKNPRRLGVSVVEIALKAGGIRSDTNKMHKTGDSCCLMTAVL
jgi:hypothetical protein